MFASPATWMTRCSKTPGVRPSKSSPITWGRNGTRLSSRSNRIVRARACCLLVFPTIRPGSPAKAIADMGVMGKNRDAIGGQMQVGFDRRDAQIESNLERRQGIFGFEPSRAAMTLKFESRRLDGYGHSVISILRFILRTFYERGR